MSKNPRQRKNPLWKYLGENHINYAAFARRAKVSKSQLGEVCMDRCRFGAEKLRRVVHATEGVITAEDLLSRRITPRRR